MIIFRSCCCESYLKLPNKIFGSPSETCNSVMTANLCLLFCFPCYGSFSIIRHHEIKEKEEKQWKKEKEIELAEIDSIDV